MTEQLDKDNLFRTPIRLKGPSAGQMLMKAINREALATSQAGEKCDHCGELVMLLQGRWNHGGTDRGFWCFCGGELNKHMPVEVDGSCWPADFPAAPPETAILAQAAPKYSLKTQLWIGAWIFLSIASGVALGFMKGCR